MMNELPWVISVKELLELQRESAAHEKQRAVEREAARQRADWVDTSLANLDDLSEDERERLDRYLHDADEDDNDASTKPLATCPVVIADVRWYLDGKSGNAPYLDGHIPGAVFVDLDTMLAGPATREEGRHPLPLEESFAAAMEVSGIADDTVVIAYDDAGGASASRLVWLLRASGHRAAVLNGGLNAWIDYISSLESTGSHPDGRLNMSGHVLESGEDLTVPEDAGAFSVRPFNADWIASIEETCVAALTPDKAVIDARAPERYQGEDEPIDSRGGHIPGAYNLFHGEFIDSHGFFLDTRDIVSHVESAGIDTSAQPYAESPIIYCGSGVTATHEIVALAHAGIHSRLYPGSWSQYSATERSMVTGPDRT